MLSRAMVVLSVLTAIVLIVGTSFTIYNVIQFPEKSFFDEAMVSVCDSSTTSQSQTESPDRQSIYEGKLVPNIAKYPWMVYLRIRTTLQSGSYVYSCGATLIDDRHVLTAAHCVSFLDFKDGFLQLKEGEEITARLGSISKDYPETVKTIESAFMHIAYRRFVKGARWEEVTGHRDIAVLRLSESLLDSPGWNTTIKPACLPTATEVSPRSCVVLGWGEFAKGQSSSASLFMKDIQRIHYTECAKSYLSVYNKTVQNIVIKQNYEDSIICTRGADICPGDSGGPMLCKTNTSPELKMFGIVSTASPEGCGSTSTPSAYINVPFFRSWLQYVALPALRNRKSSAAWLACLHQKCLDFGYVQLAKGYTDQRIKQYVTSWVCRLFPPYYYCLFLDPKPERCQNTVVPKAINILSETPTRLVPGKNGEETPVYDPIDGTVRSEVIDSLKEIIRGVSDLDTCTP